MNYVTYFFNITSSKIKNFFQASQKVRSFHLEKLPLSEKWLYTRDNHPAICLSSSNQFKGVGEGVLGNTAISKDCFCCNSLCLWLLEDLCVHLSRSSYFCAVLLFFIISVILIYEKQYITAECGCWVCVIHLYGYKFTKTYGAVDKWLVLWDCKLCAQIKLDQTSGFNYCHHKKTRCILSAVYQAAVQQTWYRNI